MTRYCCNAPTSPCRAPSPRGATACAATAMTSKYAFMTTRTYRRTARGAGQGQAPELHLNLTVVGDDMETGTQRRILAECACDACQCWLFSRTMPAGKLETLLHQHDNLLAQA